MICIERVLSSSAVTSTNGIQMLREATPWPYNSPVCSGKYNSGVVGSIIRTFMKRCTATGRRNLPFGTTTSRTNPFSSRRNSGRLVSAHSCLVTRYVSACGTTS